MDPLERATQLLRPLMAVDRRDTWLSLAFHAQHRDVYDALPQQGATADFTVGCVRRLLDRGCLGSRHALSLLLEAVQGEAGDEHQAAFQQLIAELDACCRAHGADTMTTPSTILFLASDPGKKNEDKLALDREAREIRTKIRLADLRDALEFKTEWAVRPDDLLQYLNELKPRAVHFSGHGGPGEILLQDEAGQAKPVSREALRALFRLHSKTVRLVVLNACYSRDQAEAITEVVDCAVGMDKAIGDAAAIVFAAAFYRKLGFGASVGEAFEEGRVALLLEDIPEDQTPVLLVRSGVDAGRVFLVGPDANPS